MVHSAVTSLLTIAIPTFNRSRYLRQCLSSLMPQAVAASPQVNVLIIDNASTDDTEVVCKSFLEKYSNHLQIIRNAENIGADANIAKCYLQSRSSYVWIFGDDDILSPGALASILEKLNKYEFGIVHIQTFPYEGELNDGVLKRPIGKNIFEIFSSEKTELMLYKVCDMFTFVTGNIINKSLVPTDIHVDKYLDTRLNQLQWTFGAMFAANQNMLIDDALLAINNKGDSGGYPFCKIFGTNYNFFFKLFQLRGIPARYFNIINCRMLREIFPRRIYQARTQNSFYFDRSEDFYIELKPNFKNYWEFWFFVAPMCKLPKVFLHPYFFIIRIFNRIYRYIR